MTTFTDDFVPPRRDRVLLIVPPFAGLDRPSLGVHLLQATAAQAGVAVQVLYANLRLAARIGERLYQEVCYGAPSALMGERFFAAAAYGLPALGRDGGAGVTGSSPELTERMEVLRAVQPEALAWAEEVADWVVANGYRLVGCTTTFEQTASSVALLCRIKARDPNIVTLLGGANCEGEMARGLATLPASADYLFSGECERAFAFWAPRLLAGDRPAARIVEGEPCPDIDALPRPDYSDYYDQLERWLGTEAMARGNGTLLLPYESSRGCWWGEKHHCTFCGLNASTMQHRARSAGRVIEDLRALLEHHPTRDVCMTDNIMPFAYFQTLVPRLAAELPGVRIFYEQKANLSLAQVTALRAAGIVDIQPGIEALSTPLLRLMDKGVSARQNIALLRYARATGVALKWNLLGDFPGDREEWYEETLRLVPLLVHLQPPKFFSPLSIDRFSPYFDTPDRYGIRASRPMPAYEAVLPDGCDVRRIAYHYVGEYDSAARRSPELMNAVSRAVETWIGRWDGEASRNPPSLEITALSSGTYVLYDDRTPSEPGRVQFFTREEAALLMTGAPAAHRDAFAWALDQRLFAELDGWLVPLVTAEPELMRDLETPAHPPPVHDRNTSSQPHLSRAHP